jgi:hypothetical protein
LINTWRACLPGRCRQPAEASLKQSKIAYSAVTFLGRRARAHVWRYNRARLPLPHLDAGLVSQILCTAAETIDAVCAPLHAYDDDQETPSSAWTAKNCLDLYGLVGKNVTATSRIRILKSRPARPAFLCHSNQANRKFRSKSQPQA